MKLTYEQKRELTIIGSGTKAKLREERPGKYDHRKDCVCYACMAYERAKAKCRLAYVVYGNKGDYKPLTDYALPKDKQHELPDPNKVVKEEEERRFFMRKALPEHVHVRRRLAMTLSRYLP